MHVPSLTPNHAFQPDPPVRVSILANVGGGAPVNLVLLGRIMEAGGVAVAILGTLLLGATIGALLNGVLAAKVLHLPALVGMWPALLAPFAMLIVNASFSRYSTYNSSSWKPWAILFIFQVLFQFLALRRVEPSPRRIGVAVGLSVLPWAVIVALPFLMPHIVRMGHAAP